MFFRKTHHQDAVILFITAEHLEALGLGLSLQTTMQVSLHSAPLPLQVTQLVHSDETGLVAGTAPWQAS